MFDHPNYHDDIRHLSTYLWQVDEKFCDKILHCFCCHSFLCDVISSMCSFLDCRGVNLCETSEALDGLLREPIDHTHTQIEPRFDVRVENERHDVITTFTARTLWRYVAPEPQFQKLTFAQYKVRAGSRPVIEAFFSETTQGAVNSVGRCADNCDRCCVVITLA